MHIKFLSLFLSELLNNGYFSSHYSVCVRLLQIAFTRNQLSIYVWNFLKYNQFSDYIYISICHLAYK